MYSNMVRPPLLSDIGILTFCQMTQKYNIHLYYSISLEFFLLLCHLSLHANVNTFYFFFSTLNHKNNGRLHNKSQHKLASSYQIKTYFNIFDGWRQYIIQYNVIPHHMNMLNDIMLLRINILLYGYKTLNLWLVMT